MTIDLSNELHPRIPELLAPAGGREQFFAALNAGADAVYLGLKAFNARSRAENFTPDDLRELVPLAHAYGMKVLVTLNVLIKDTELEALVDTMSTLEELEVDAIIVQDLAVARIARTYFPALTLHASTQMAVHNLAGVLEAKAHGFRCVVLARELTATEMKRIRAAVPAGEIELEAFCHGSLCYSYSGLCFFSGAEDARSGNRGECAYTCRQPYEILNEPGHGFLFSMRDLDTSKSLDLFVKSGVDTLKIEGRKKDAQYVASTVSLYRRRLDELYGFPTLRQSAPKEAVLHTQGTPAEAEGDLALSFQRRRTSFFLKGRYVENVIDLDNPTHTGLRVGSVLKVNGRRITVKSDCALERFDGLRLIPAGRVYHSLPQDGRLPTSDVTAARGRYENQHVEFSLRELRVGGQRVAAAPAGCDVEIELPEGTEPPAVGSLVHKVRSADLKRRVTALAVPPQGAKPRAVSLVAISVEVRAAGDMAGLTARATKFGETVATVDLAVPYAVAKGESTLASDVEAAFALLGEAGFRATSVQFSGDGNLFVPRSRLKALKQALGEALQAEYAPFLARRRDRARAGVCTPVQAGGSTRDRVISVKSDRLETLRHAAAYAKAHPDFALAELVFEPKRAFLPEFAPEALADELSALSREAGVPLRLAVPTVMRAWDEPLLKRWFIAAHAAGLRHAEVGNLGAFELLRSWGLVGAGLDLASDFTLYALSSAATRFWRERGVSQVALSVEDDSANLRAQLARLTPVERAGMQAVIYKDTPLFIAEACSLTALHGGCPTAQVCGYRTLEIQNPKGEKFHVAHESCKSIVYGDEAFSLTHAQNELMGMGIGRMRVDFLTRAYSEDAAWQVLDAVWAKRKLEKTHPANFHRTLL